MRAVLDTSEICVQLSLPAHTVLCASRVEESVEGNHRLVGRKPSVIYAAIIYAAALKTDFPLSFSQLRKITGVQEPSIRKMTFLLFELIGDEIPDKHLHKNRADVVQFRLHASRCRDDE